jgi:hypothetical protein
MFFSAFPMCIKHGLELGGQIAVFTFERKSRASDLTGLI